MTDAKKASLETELNEFTKRLRACDAELRSSGEFSDVHQTMLAEIQQRADALRSRVTQAQTTGSAWELVKTEFARDFESLYDDLLELEDRLDSGAMNNR